MALARLLAVLLAVFVLATAGIALLDLRSWASAAEPPTRPSAGFRPAPPPEPLPRVEAPEDVLEETAPPPVGLRSLNFGRRVPGGATIRGTLFAPSHVRPLWGLLEAPEFCAQVWFDDLGRMSIEDLAEGDYVLTVRATGAGRERWGCEMPVRAGQSGFVLHLRPLVP